MNSSFQLNQGESNSYKNKIEYSFEKSNELAGMSLIDCQKNMPFDYESDDGYFSHNEDRCDYYSEDDEDRDYEAEDYEAIIKKTDADIYTEANEKYYSQPKLQDPDKMTKILPARILPSVEEQEKEYSDWLASELLKAMQLKAVPIIERFFSYCLSTKSTRAQLDYDRLRQQQLDEWKKLYDTPRSPRGIKRLDPLPPFEEEYLKYSAIAAEDEKKKAIEQEAIDKAKAESQWKQRMIEQKKADRINGKKRAIAKKGMNKNTAWHRARTADSLALKDKSTPVIGVEGKGKRAQRKIKREKRRQEAIEYQERLNLCALSAPAQVEEPMPMPDIEISEEDEEAELALILSLINKPCKNKIDVYVEEQKYQATEKKKADKKERESWTTIATKKTKKVMSLDEFSNPIGIIKQSVKKRSSDDEKYAMRCDAFEVLGDKEKLGEALKFTQMCRSIIQGKKCYHAKCRFAHSVDQLTKRNCRFGVQCKFVKHIGQGKYIAQRFGRTGKTCSCYHPNETEQSFCLRLNLKYTPKPVTPKPVTPAAHEGEMKYDSITGVEVPPKPVAPVSVWASIVTTTEAKVKYAEAKAKMTRSWSSVVSSPRPSPKHKPVTPKNIITITKPKFVWIQPAPTPVTPTPATPTPVTPTPASPMDKVREAVEKINQRISKNRSIEEDWTPAQSKRSKKKKDTTTVFKVRKENAEMVMLSIIRSGIKDFKIEIIDE